VIGVTDLPALNAGLNLTAAILIGAGFFFIRRKNIQAHKTCMVAALIVSAFFLASYLTYHYNVGSVRFTRQGWIRSVYFPLLLTHTVLAAVVVPMVLRSVFLAWKGRFPKHVRIARYTFPVWMYVSITGVLVYLMLYQL
jgi:putative membrane protein